MSFLIDTCVLSELTRPRPEPSVTLWLEQTPAESKFVSVLSLGEIMFGIGRSPVGIKRTRLEAWYRQVLRPSLAERVVTFDEIASLRWADLRAHARSARILDSQIAASALVHGLTLVTRNVNDFDFDGLAVFNPWPK